MYYVYCVVCTDLKNSNCSKKFFKLRTKHYTDIPYPIYDIFSDSLSSSSLLLFLHRYMLHLSFVVCSKVLWEIHKVHGHEREVEDTSKPNPKPTFDIHTQALLLLLRLVLLFGCCSSAEEWLLASILLFFSTPSFSMGYRAWLGFPLPLYTVEV